MRQLLPVLAALLLSPIASPAEEALDIRYRDASGRMSLTLDQDIHVQTQQSIASRELSFDLALSLDPEAAAIEVTVDRARATYTAHGMGQRLGTRHITGRAIPLAIGKEGRQLEPPADPSADATIQLGAIVEGGLSVGSLIVDTLPVLPEESVRVGATWTTEQPIRTLEGWAWATGQMTSRHRVTAVDRRAGHTVFSVATRATANLAAVEGGRAYTGKLTRTLSWTFDATDGRLLSLSMDQETEGETVLPQGDLPVRQSTRLELSPLT